MSKKSKKLNIMDVGVIEYLMSLHQSPVELERLTGLSGIAGHYFFPNGQSSTDFNRELSFKWGKLFRDGRKDESAKHLAIEYLIKVYDEMAELNPILKTFEIDKSDNHPMIDILSGMAYRFPMEDIIWFAIDGNYAKKSEDSIPKWKEREQLVHELTGEKVWQYIGWVLSPTTQNRIIDQLLEREKNPERAQNLRARYEALLDDNETSATSNTIQQQGGGKFSTPGLGGGRLHNTHEAIETLLRIGMPLTNPENGMEFQPLDVLNIHAKRVVGKLEKNYQDNVEFTLTPTTPDMAWAVKAFQEAVVQKLGKTIAQCERSTPRSITIRVGEILRLTDPLLHSAAQTNHETVQNKELS